MPDFVFAHCIIYGKDNYCFMYVLSKAMNVPTPCINGYAMDGVVLTKVHCPLRMWVRDVSVDTVPILVHCASVAVVSSSTGVKEGFPIVAIHR